MKLAMGVLALLGAAVLGHAGDDLEIYMRDGRLRAPLILREVQGGFAGFTGKEIKIDVDGKFTITQIVGKKPSVKSKGEINKDKLKALAEEMAKFDLVGLKNHGKPAANPQVVAVEFGRITGTLYWQAGQALPRPNSGDTASLPERYSGIVQAVQDALARR